MEIKNEGDFYKLLTKLEIEGRITHTERDAMHDYVCGIFDALDAKYDCKEEDLQ